MKNKLLLSFRAFLLSLLFFVGTQISAEAQMTVFNNTSCTLIVKVGQFTSSSCSPCNSNAITALPPGGTWSHPYDPACGPELWLGLKFAVIGGFGAGASYNPSLGGTCGSTLPTICNGGIITANWLSAGAGPATVIIN